MEKTRIPLQKWFLAIGLVVNAKKSLSSYQLARDLELNQKSAWYMQQRIRAQKLSAQHDILFQSIVEADATYIGDKPRKSHHRDNDPPPIILGAGAQARFRSWEWWNAVTPEGSLLITDEYRAYNVLREVMPHAVIHHGRQYADGFVHTNTIEGVWALLKKAWYGSHRLIPRRLIAIMAAPRQHLIPVVGLARPAPARSDGVARQG